MEPTASSVPARFRRVNGRTRRSAFGFGLAVVVLVVLGRWLAPSPAGHGTHTQLGLPPCTLMYFFDFPCPLCGATTAFSLAAHGRYIQALLTHPFGALVFAALLLAAIVCFAVSATGFAPSFTMDHVPRWAWQLVVVLAGLSWLYKIIEHLWP